MTDIILTPAYGKDYRSKAEVIQAFESGADFIYNNMFDPIFNGKYCSIRDLPTFTKQGYGIKLRFNKLRFAVHYTKLERIHS